jgi:hypothetical protein
MPMTWCGYSNSQQGLFFALLNFTFVPPFIHLFFSLLCTSFLLPSFLSSVSYLLYLYLQYWNSFSFSHCILFMLIRWSDTISCCIMSRSWALVHIMQVQAPEQAWLTEAFLTFLNFRIVPQIISRPLLSTSIQFIFSQSPCCHPAGAAYGLFALTINKYRFVFPRHNSLLFIETSRSHSDTPHTVGLLWTSDEPDAQNSTWQNTTLTRDRQQCPRWDSSPQSQQARGCRPTP